MSPRETTAAVADVLGVPHGRCAGTRLDALPAVLVRVGVREGAEVGVERGHYAQHLCRHVPGLHLRCVDAWQAYPGYREHVSQDKLDGFYAGTIQRLQGLRVTIMRGFSSEVASRLTDGSLDFVYLDANHAYPHVWADLVAWSPKVRPGGIMAGHDYGRTSVGQVREAVDDWTRAHGITPWWVLAGDRSPSWLWVA